MLVPNHPDLGRRIRYTHTWRGQTRTATGVVEGVDVQPAEDWPGKSLRAPLFIVRLEGYKTAAAATKAFYRAEFEFDD